ncbi:hypothetical protein PR202_gb18912 [Eleusine coracana subsp. coracana]|uniref:Uncharacterized protein n=1 Tax=Eleusine coracana subsp. coracana TaxID=191504 RepID=A0AAV5F6U7_ELECO|nr:hypothetical protein PR202_gb18912 [Eleusine coracana subsp. coracana]
MLVRNGTRRGCDATLGAEAVAPAVDGDAQPDTAASPIRRIDDPRSSLEKQMACLPPVESLHTHSYSRRCRQGQLRLSASVSNNVNKPLVSEELNSHCEA